MYPELISFQFGSYALTIMSYSFFYVCAVIFVLIGSFLSAVKSGFTIKKTVIMIAVMTIAGFVGARGLHFLFNPAVYKNGELSIFDIHMTGFTVVGGIMCAVTIGGIVGKILHVDIWKFADRTIPFVGFGIAIARIGCFLNGCCFGFVTHVPWGVHFPLLSQTHIHQMTHGVGNIFSVAPIHPTQLYEMIAVIIGSVVAFCITKKNIFPGAAILFFGMWYSCFRLLNSFFREMPDSLALSIGKYGFIYIGIFILCLVIFVLRLRKTKKDMI